MIGALFKEYTSNDILHDDLRHISYLRGLGLPEALSDFGFRI